MADEKITGLGVATTLVDTDLVEVVDVSDTSMAASGTNKQITVGDLKETIGINLLSALAGNGVSTGWRDGGLITQDADPAKYDVALGAGVIVDNYTDPENPVPVEVTWSAFNAQAHLTGNLTFVGIIDSGGGVGALTQQTTPFTSSQLRDVIPLGGLVHSGGLVSSAIDLPSPAVIQMFDSDATLRDFLRLFGGINVSGNVYDAASTDLTIKVSSGQIFLQGDNAQNNKKDPDNQLQSAEDPIATFTTIHQSAPGVFELTFSETDIDPLVYDTGSGLDDVGNNNWQIMRFNRFADGTSVVQYGQVAYNTLADAILGLTTEAPVTSTALNNAAFRGFLLVKKEATDLSSAAVAEFRTSDNLIIGGAAGGGAANVIIVEESGTPVNGTSNTIDFLEGITAEDGGSGTANVRLTQINKRDATAAPTANDDAADTSGNGVFTVGSKWTDVTADVVYECVDSTATSAVWKNLSAVSSLPDTVTGVAHATGSAWVLRKDNMAATVAPDADDDTGSGYIIGSVWFDVTNDKIYRAIDVTAATAVWKELSGGSITYPFDMQLNIDVSGGNDDYVIHDDSGLPYTILSINALKTDVGTLTAGVEINTTAVTGISVAVTTTKQTVADAATALNAVVATDEVSIAVTAVATSPGILTGVLHCERTITF